MLSTKLQCSMAIIVTVRFIEIDTTNSAWRQRGELIAKVCTGNVMICTDGNYLNCGQTLTEADWRNVPPNNTLRLWWHRAEACHIDTCPSAASGTDTAT